MYVVLDVVRDKFCKKIDCFAFGSCTLEEVSHTERGEAGSKSSGYAKQLSTFSMYFSLKLLYMVFSRSEALAHSLQSPKLSLAKLQE